MEHNTLDWYFEQWRDRQVSTRLFEWGSTTGEEDSKLVLVRKTFGEMTDDEKRMVWEFKVWPAIAAIE